MFNSYIKLKVSISFIYDSVSEVHRKPLGKKAVTNLDGVLKSRDIASSTKVHIKAMVFSRSHAWMYGVTYGGGNGNPFQYSYLENPMDREAWLTTVYGVARVKHDLATKPPPPACTDMRVEPYRRLSTKESMLLNHGVGEDSSESLGLQGDPTSAS